MDVFFSSSALSRCLCSSLFFDLQTSVSTDGLSNTTFEIKSYLTLFMAWRVLRIWRTTKPHQLEWKEMQVKHIFIHSLTLKYKLQANQGKSLSFSIWQIVIRYHFLNHFLCCPKSMMQQPEPNPHLLSNQQCCQNRALRNPQKTAAHQTPVEIWGPLWNSNPLKMCW